MIRIISGKLRGRKIRAPKNLPVRPTTDRAKEALFNILNNLFYLNEISALDLFSGTGNISYELASRGVRDVSAVDANAYCTRFIKNTAEQLKLSEITVITAEVQKFLSREFRQFDLIFADPPYDYEYYEKIVDTVMLNRLLTDNGVLIIEHNSKESLSQLDYFDQVRNYGNVAFSFFSISQPE